MADGDGRYDVIVIGAGLVGLATAMALLAQRPGLQLAVLERKLLLAPTRAGTTPASSTPACTTSRTA